MNKTPKFNRTNENIEWAKWTWNPVTGCKHGCPYCYARDIAMRFTGHFEPTFHPYRLKAPANTSPKLNGIGERNVFVCSMADLFGDWVPQEWIDAVLETVRKYPQWNYLFLTKNPRRLVDIAWPDNAWVGTTVDTQRRVEPAQEVFSEVNASVRFLSCEPLRERLVFDSLEMFDWLIIGGQSRSTRLPERQPDLDWVTSLIGKARESACKIYCKPNLRVPGLSVHLKEYPRGRGRGIGNFFGTIPRPGGGHHARKSPPS